MKLGKWVLYQAQVKWFSHFKSDVFLNVIWQCTCILEIYFVFMPKVIGRFFVVQGLENLEATTLTNFGKLVGSTQIITKLKFT